MSKLELKLRWKCAHCGRALLALTLLACFFLSSYFSGSARADESPYSSALSPAWEKLREALQDNNFAAVNEQVEALKTARDASGILNLEPYSLALIDEAAGYLRASERDKAASLTRRAIELSPQSPRVLFRASPIARRSGADSSFSLMLKGLSLIPARGEWVMKTIIAAIYPSLWSLTLGMYIGFVLLLIERLVPALKTLGRMCPPAFKHLMPACFLTLVFMLPITLGPLWCLFVWSIFILLAIPERRFLAFAAGTLLVLWGTLIPLRENMQLWIEDPGVQAMLRVGGGSYSRSDSLLIERYVSQHGTDGVGWYMRGQVLLRDGKFAEASDSFSRAGVLIANEGGRIRALASQGMALFLQGKTAEALDHLQAADQAGLADAGLYYNMSRLLLETLRTEESREYFKKALAADKETTERLREREDLVPLGAATSLAELSLPWWVLLGTSLSPRLGSHEMHDTMAQVIMFPLNPIAIVGFGIALLALFFFVGTQPDRFPGITASRTMWHILRALLLLIPGGLWVLRGQPVRAAVVASFGVFLISPLIGWPDDSRNIFIVAPDLKGVYFAALGLFVLTIAFLGFEQIRREG